MSRNDAVEPGATQNRGNSSTVRAPPLEPDDDWGGETRQHVIMIQCISKNTNKTHSDKKKETLIEVEDEPRTLESHW
jgi:hypothetical protein